MNTDNCKPNKDVIVPEYVQLRDAPDPMAALWVFPAALIVLVVIGAIEYWLI